MSRFWVTLEAQIWPYEALEVELPRLEGPAAADEMKLFYKYHTCSTMYVNLIKMDADDLLTCSRNAVGVQALRNVPRTESSKY